MSKREGLAEAVLVFEPDGLTVSHELRLEDFQSMIAGLSSFEEFAASIAKAAYVVVGDALSVQGIAFFTFRVDEDGRVDPVFNLPLRYLVDNAGTGPDLGAGPIRLACRSQCPVPWHSVNLWQPLLEGDDSAAVRVQKAVWRNRLGLKASGRLELNPDEVQLDADHAANHTPADLLFGEDLPRAPNGNGGPNTLPARTPEPPAPPRAASPRPATPRPAAPRPAAPRAFSSPLPPPAHNGGREEHEARLTEAFGPEGKVNVEKLVRQHNEQMARVSERYRGDLERQQQMYLDQIRNCRNEIQRLKSALRQEQDRSRRLQQLLRGEP
jgi:hypothetical protein